MKKKQLPRHQHLATNHLLIRNIDNLLDLYDNDKLGNRLDQFPGWDAAFPRAARLARLNEEAQKEGSKDLHFCKRLWQHMAYRMRSAWHPDARSYVYAYAYRWQPAKEAPTDDEIEAVYEAMCSMSSGRRDEGMDAYNLVKIGTAYSPEVRRKSHLGELDRMLTERGLPQGLGGYRYNCCLLLLPCWRGDAGEYLEGAILNSMPKEDQFQGEWFHDTYGVTKMLALWFVLSHASQPVLGR